MTTSKSILCCIVVVGLGAKPATAAVYDLRAATTTITMSDGMQIPMWGFGPSSGAVTVPGPVLVVPPGDTTLTLNLTNQLAVPVSIVIPQLPAPLAPVWNDGTTGPRTNLQQRAVSFTHVAQPGETVVYEWTNVQPGTYSYQSGTHPAVQVPMGLYGAVKHEAVQGQSYDVAYDRDLVLVYSEVDPTLNLAVAGGTYGTPSYPSTIDYRPRYFLINGQQATSPVELQIAANERLLLRTVNAGLRSIVPALSSGTMTLLAEDGQRAPFTRASYSMLLPPGKTRDALFALTEPGSTVLFDRRGGSRLARITATELAPVAVADGYATTEDTTLDTAIATLPSVLDNDTGFGLTAVLDSSTSNGSLMLRPDGSFSYTPAPDFNGSDGFSYHATDGVLSSNVVTVSLAVAPANDAPVAIDNGYGTTQGTTLIVAPPGVLANDNDVDGDALMAQLVQGPSAGVLTLTTTGSFEYTANPGTMQDSFAYEVTDGVTVSNLATVTIEVAPNNNASPIATNDFAMVRTSRIINVVANDSDSDGTVDATSVTVTTPPTSGTTTNLGNGTVRYRAKPGFVGFDSFRYVVRDNHGAASAPATVRIFVWRWL